MPISSAGYKPAVSIGGTYEQGIDEHLYQLVTVFWVWLCASA
jgi:hypothetical protein